MNCIVSNGIISDAAFLEAKEWFLKGELPENFSHDKPLLKFTNLSLDEGEVEQEEYKRLVSLLDLSYLEYDEAVLLGVLELVATHA